MVWYRATTWTAADAVAFESKLARARSWIRPQYLRIQGLTLSMQPEKHLREVGRGLLRRVLLEYDGLGEDTVAAEELADSLLDDGHLDHAVEAYLDALRRIHASPAGRNGTSWVTELGFAETLIRRGHDGDLPWASELLDAVQPEIEEHGLVRDLVFRFLAARAHVADRSGSGDAGGFARAALEVVGPAAPDVHAALDSVRVADGVRIDLERIASTD